VRGSAAFALGKVGADVKKIVPPLLDALDDEEASVRSNILLTVAALGRDATERRRACSRRSRIPTPAYAAGRRSPWARSVGAERGGAGLTAALKTATPASAPAPPAPCKTCRRRPRASPALLVLLKDEDSEVRRNASAALTEIGAAGNKEAPALLAAALKDRDREVRRNAAFALGELGPEAKAAIPPCSRRPGKRRRRAPLRRPGPRRDRPRRRQVVPFWSAC